MTFNITQHEFTTFFKYHNDLYFQPCTVIDSARMSCPSPPIDLPTEYKDLDMASPQEVSYNTTNADSRRAKRDVEVRPLNDPNHGLLNTDKLGFYINLKLDGVIPYEPEKGKPPKMYTLSVYRNPIVQPFPVTPLVYKPKKKGGIIIKVNGPGGILDMTN